MTNFDSHDALIEMLDRLWEPNLRREIDAPLEAVAGDLLQTPPPQSRRAFAAAVSAAAGQFWREGMRPPRQLDGSQSLAEAVDLLNAGYPDGYAAALLDVRSDPADGWPRVVLCLCEGLKHRRRTAQRRSLLSRLLTRLDFRQRRRLARRLRMVGGAGYRRQLPRELSACAAHLEQLLAGELDTRNACWPAHA